MKTLLFILASMLAGCGCDGRYEDPMKSPLDKEPLWESGQLYPGLSNEAYRGIHHFQKIPVYGGVIFTGYTDIENKLRYAGLDVNTGGFVWKSDFFNKTLSQSTTERYQVQRNEMFYFYGIENNYDVEGNPISSFTPFYAFNIVTGDLSFEKIYPQYFTGSVAMLREKNNVFVSLEPRCKNEQTGASTPNFWISYNADFDNREMLEVPLMNSFVYGNDSHAKGEVLDFEITTDGSDLFLVYTVHEPKFDQAPYISKEFTNYHINCYNLSKMKWAYAKKECTGGGIVLAVDGYYIFYGQPGSGGFGNIDAGMRKFNWKTGDLFWYLSEDEINGNRQVSLAYAGYDAQRNMFVSAEIGGALGIDATEGKVKWRSVSIGNEISPILIHNGVAYAVGGRVYAFDVATGEQLMEARCPSEGRVINGEKLPGFLGQIGMYIREDGKPIIIAKNHMYAYAFEGVR